MKTNRIYEPSFDYAIPSIINFSYEINSLYRYWQFCQDKIASHIEHLENTPQEILSNYEEELKKFQREKAEGVQHDQDTKFFYEAGWTEEELLMHFNDNEAGDRENFPLFLFHSVTDSLVKIFHQMLIELAKEITIKDYTSATYPKDLWNLQKNFSRELDQLFEPTSKIDRPSFSEIKEAFAKVDIDIEEEIRIIKELTDKPLYDLKFVENCFDEIVVMVQHSEMACIAYFKEEEN